MRSPHASGLNQTLQHYILNITLLLRLLICLCGRWLPFAGDNALGGDERVEEAKTQSATLPPRRTGIAHILFEKRWLPLSLLYSSV